MAFPVVVTEATSSTDSNSTSQVVNYPASLVNGNLLVCIIAIDGAITVTWPAGWTEFLDQNRSGVSISCGWRIVDGSEGASFTITSSGSEQSVARVWQVSGHDPGQAPEALSANSASTPNPPSLTPTGGAKDYLWIAAAALQNGNDNTATGFPTNYTNTGQSAGGAATGQAPLAWCRRELNAASEDPAAFTTTISANCMAVTVAIHPASAPAVNLPAIRRYYDMMRTA